MLDKLLSYGSMIGMAFAVLIYIQTNFVDAMDFKQYQYDMVEFEVNYLKDKKLRLEHENKELTYEDERQLERQMLKLQKLQQEIK
jgi:hypothetical protein